jgi:hypothetical protein
MVGVDLENYMCRNENSPEKSTDQSFSVRLRSSLLKEEKK